MTKESWNFLTWTFLYFISWLLSKELSILLDTFTIYAIKISGLNIVCYILKEHFFSFSSLKFNSTANPIVKLLVGHFKFVLTKYIDIMNFNMINLLNILYIVELDIDFDCYREEIWLIILRLQKLELLGLELGVLAHTRSMV